MGDPSEMKSSVPELLYPIGEDLVPITLWGFVSQQYHKQAGLFSPCLESIGSIFSNLGSILCLVRDRIALWSVLFLVLAILPL